MYSFICNTSPGTHLSVESLQSINWILLKILFIKTQLILLALTSVKRANNLFSPSHKLNTLHWGFTVQQWDFIFDTKKRWIFQSDPHRGHAVACYAQWTGALYLPQQLLVSAAVRGTSKLDGKWIVTRLFGGRLELEPYSFCFLLKNNMFWTLTWVIHNTWLVRY